MQSRCAARSTFPTCGSTRRASYRPPRPDAVVLVLRSASIYYAGAPVVLMSRRSGQAEAREAVNGAGMKQTTVLSVARWRALEREVKYPAQ